jgi:hypothetical protein
MQVELMVTDPGVFTKPWSLTYDLEFQPDTEMVEAVCEEQTRWIGRLSDVERSAITVPEKTLAKYVGVVQRSLDYPAADGAGRTREWHVCTRRGS